jgi:hypothetical protein
LAAYLDAVAQSDSTSGVNVTDAEGVAV